MTLSIPRAPLSKHAESDAVSTSMAELIQSHCQSGQRHALRIIGLSARGHVFFDKGRVVYAEFGEDVGLRAVVQMQRAGDIQTQPCTRRWPTHPSLNLDAATLLAGRNRRVEETPHLRKTGVVKRERVERMLPPAVNDEAQFRQVEPEPPPLPPVVEAAKPEVPMPEVQRAESDLSARIALATASCVQREKRSVVPPAKPRRASNKASLPVAESVTTMVRLSQQGQLLAARGDKSESLADVAAYIHDLVKLVASDLNRSGPASIHLRGGGVSLIVAHSETKDLAAALGPTVRLTRLLAKTGHK